MKCRRRATRLKEKKEIRDRAIRVSAAERRETARRETVEMQEKRTRLKEKRK